MKKLKLLAAVALCLAYFSGIATGWAGYTLAGEKPACGEERSSWLSHTLGLNEEQKATMEEIWSREGRGRDGDESRSVMRTLYEERNLQVRALLTEEQAKAFDDIYTAFEEKKEAISEERHQRHEDSVQRTMAILTPDQQERYKKILDDFERRGTKRKHGRGN